MTNHTNNTNLSWRWIAANKWFLFGVITLTLSFARLQHQSTVFENAILDLRTDLGEHIKEHTHEGSKEHIAVLLAKGLAVDERVRSLEISRNDMARELGNLAGTSKMMLEQLKGLRADFQQKKTRLNLDSEPSHGRLVAQSSEKRPQIK